MCSNVAASRGPFATRSITQGHVIEFCWSSSDFLGHLLVSISFIMHTMQQV